MHPPDSPVIAGLILAGGLSRRLGRPKQMLLYGSGTLLEHVIAETEAVPELDPILVVLPPDERLVPGPAVRRAGVIRRIQGEGCSNSLRAGLDALPPDSIALATVPADQPALTSDLISLAVRSWLRSRPLALTLSYQGQPGHPFIFAASLFDRLRALHGDKAMWRLLEELQDAVERLEVDAPLPQDVDTWDDYQRLIGYPALAGGTSTC